MTRWGAGVGAGAVPFGSGVRRGMFTQLVAAVPHEVADFTQPALRDSANGGSTWHRTDRFPMGVIRVDPATS